MIYIYIYIYEYANIFYQVVNGRSDEFGAGVWGIHIPETYTL